MCDLQGIEYERIEEGLGSNYWRLALTVFSTSTSVGLRGHY